MVIPTEEPVAVQEVEDVKPEKKQQRETGESLRDKRRPFKLGKDDWELVTEDGKYWHFRYRR